VGRFGARRVRPAALGRSASRTLSIGENRRVVPVQAVNAFLEATAAGDAAGALEVLRSEPSIPAESLHVAAVLGLEAEVRRQLSEDGSQVAVRAGDPPGDPLLWLCHSPFHGTERDDGLAAAARVLLDAGANPNARDAGKYALPALYGVTGRRNVPRIAELLLKAGADPTDGESVFHAAENHHEEALELLLRFGVDVNANGDWGNTPLYFLLRYWDIGLAPERLPGLRWLLDHGADPNVLCGPERESSLHVAARRGQPSEIVRLLLGHGADVHIRRGDGRTAWILARRGGFDEVADVLERAGAPPEDLTQADRLLVACGRGDVEAARRLAAGATLESEDNLLLPEAASRGRFGMVRACLAAGFPVDTPDEFGATALHHASIRGNAELVGELLDRGADRGVHDGEHDSTPLGWAEFGRDIQFEPAGDYDGCIRALQR